MKTINYGRQEITESDIEAVVSTLKSDYLTQGPKIKEFENKFADYIGSVYAVAVSNGTAALHLSAMVNNVNSASNVITSPITFAASANCVRYCGGNVHFVDIDPKTFLLDVDKVKKLIESKPDRFFSGIIPVSFAGYPFPVEELQEICEKHNLWIIEDACHAPGAYTRKDGRISKSGASEYSQTSIFSFHPVKHIATGEGGMITTNSKELYQRLLLLRTHGITKDPDLLKNNDGGWYYEMQELGYNYRMPDICAALGVEQLKKASAGIERRNEIAIKYDEMLKDLPLDLPYRESSINHAFHLYIIQTPKRKELYEYLKEQNIYCQVHYIPVHLQPYYQNLGFSKGDFPIAEDYYQKCLSLPMYPSLSDEELTYVIDKIKLFFE